MNFTLIFIAAFQIFIPLKTKLTPTELIVSLPPDRPRSSQVYGDFGSFGFHLYDSHGCSFGYERQDRFAFTNRFISFQQFPRTQELFFMQTRGPKWYWGRLPQVARPRELKPVFPPPEIVLGWDRFPIDEQTLTLFQKGRNISLRSSITENENDILRFCRDATGNEFGRATTPCRFDTAVEYCFEKQERHRIKLVLADDTPIIIQTNNVAILEIRSTPSPRSVGYDVTIKCLIPGGELATILDPPHQPDWRPPLRYSLIEESWRAPWPHILYEGGGQSAVVYLSAREPQRVLDIWVSYRATAVFETLYGKVLREASLED